MFIGPSVSVGPRSTRNNVFQSRVTFGRVIDGLSNTMMIAEEHVPPKDLGGEWDEPTCLFAAYRNHDDYCKPQFGVAPHAEFVTSGNINYTWMYGSWHPQVFMAAMGDASVRPVSNWITTTALQRACDRADGKEYEFP